MIYDKYGVNVGKTYKLMLDSGAKYYNWSLEMAARGRHIDIAHLMLDLGANSYNLSIATAIKHNHRMKSQL